MGRHWHGRHDPYPSVIARNHILITKITVQGVPDWAHRCLASPDIPGTHNTSGKHWIQHSSKSVLQKTSASHPVNGVPAVTAEASGQICDALGIRCADRGRTFPESERQSVHPDEVARWRMQRAGGMAKSRRNVPRSQSVVPSINISERPRSLRPGVEQTTAKTGQPGLSESCDGA